MTTDADTEYTDDILQLVREVNEQESLDLEDEMLTDAESVGVITNAERFQILEKALYYIQNQIECTIADGVVFRKWRNYADRKRISGETKI